MPVLDPGSPVLDPKSFVKLVRVHVVTENSFHEKVYCLTLTMFKSCIEVYLLHKSLECGEAAVLD